ncbi:unnamed protein product [Parnassius apollo]|uniref:(apollo) hypothetical protein n=1 Tax=Parnassius apollo TaxID=110799 RepID=A0A8S3WX67_PARAO|nr:unnamed protein product [Parnassius apollo]
MLNESVELLPVPNTMKIHQIINNVDLANSIFYRCLSCLFKLRLSQFEICGEMLNEKSIPSKTSITVLADIKNTQENRSYFNLRQYGPFNLKQINLKTDIASKSLKENSHDRMKKCSKKRKIKEIHLKINKKLKTEEESSTDEDMTISLHDTSDEEYHITDDILSDDDYLYHMDYQLKEQKNVTNLRKISDTIKIEREKIEQSSHEDTYTGKNTREINIFSNENQGVVKTNLAGQSVIATTLQDDENNFANAKNDSEVTSKINTDIWRLSFKDTVLVRYYQRTAWKYYIGFLEDSFKKEGKSYFTIRFLKTIKKPELKFIIHKIKDEDTVTEDLIVKQVKITQNTKRPKEYFLADPSDKVYFE